MEIHQWQARKLNFLESTLVHDFHCQDPNKLIKKQVIQRFYVKLFIQFKYGYHENLKVGRVKVGTKLQTIYIKIKENLDEPWGSL